MVTRKQHETAIAAIESEVWGEEEIARGLRNAARNAALASGRGNDDPIAVKHLRSAECHSAAAAAFRKAITIVRANQ